MATFNFTTGPATLPDVGELSYNKCVFGPLFNTNGEVIGITNMGYNFSQGLNFAIPSRYVKDFVRNREAFAFDPSNPNSGHRYHPPPTRARPGIAPELRTGTDTPAEAGSGRNRSS